MLQRWYSMCYRDVDCCCCSFVDAMPLLCTSCHHNRLLTRGQDNVSRGLSPELLAYYRRQCLLVTTPPPPLLPFLHTCVHVTC